MWPAAILLAGALQVAAHAAPEPAEPAAAGVEAVAAAGGCLGPRCSTRSSTASARRHGADAPLPALREAGNALHFVAFGSAASVETNDFATGKEVTSESRLKPL